jgi:hypothetical protein
MIRRLLLGGLCLSCLMVSVGAGTVEDQFIIRMREADLTGTWIPLQGGALGVGKPDTYRVVRATRKEGERWEIVWRVSQRGQSLELPLPCKITFAGDVAVLILDELEMGEGRRYSARVMFHEKIYTGHWWSAGGEGGLLNGKVTAGTETEATGS